MNSPLTGEDLSTNIFVSDVPYAVHEVGKNDVIKIKF